jgi:hypothetical protein
MKSILFSTLPLISLNLAPIAQTTGRAGRPSADGPSFGQPAAIDLNLNVGTMRDYASSSNHANVVAELTGAKLKK